MTKLLRLWLCASLTAFAAAPFARAAAPAPRACCGPSCPAPKPAPSKDCCRLLPVLPRADAAVAPSPDVLPAAVPVFAAPLVAAAAPAAVPSPRAPAALSAPPTGRSPPAARPA